MAEQQGVGPTTPDPDVAPALPVHPSKSQARSKVPTVKGWRSSPRFVNHLGKRRAPSPALLEERPERRRAQPRVLDFSWRTFSDLFLGYLNCRLQKS